MLLGVQDGIADIGYEPTVFHPDKLPLEQVSFATPFCTSDVLKVTKAIDVLHEKFPAMKAQYDKYNVIRLAGGSFDSYEFFSSFPLTRLRISRDARSVRTARSCSGCAGLVSRPSTAT